MRSNLDKVDYLPFHAATMFLIYIIQRITLPPYNIFRNPITIHHCMALLPSGASVANVTSLFVLNVGITYRRKLESMILR
jgi:hypothetical protein